MLTERQITGFANDGFLAIDEGVFTSSELAAVQARIDRLYEDRLHLPRRRTKGALEVSALAPQLSEILGATVLDPELMTLAVVQRCRQIAAELLARRQVWLHFDHVFYKASGNSSTVPWHQDSAYSVTGMTSKAVHFWIPFQDVDQSSGCMKYLPGSHLTGLQQHAVRVREDGLVFRSVEIDEAEAVACPLHVGGLVCHAPMTMHGSGLNTGGAMRRAWVLQFGIGPWVALRHIGRPLLTAGARLQMAAGRTRS